MSLRIVPASARYRRMQALSLLLNPDSPPRGEPALTHSAEPARHGGGRAGVPHASSRDRVGLAVGCAARPARDSRIFRRFKISLSFRLVAS